MDLTRFLAILAATPVLSAEDKERHGARASGYSPALRERMAAIIAEEEAKLVSRHAARKTAAMERARNKMETLREYEQSERKTESRSAGELVSDAFA